MPDYIATGGFVVAKEGTMVMDAVCTVGEAARAYLHMAKGPAICNDRGHDFSMRVTYTRNMYLCFRCGEPGWEVPTFDD